MTTSLEDLSGTTNLVLGIVFIYLLLGKIAEWELLYQLRLLLEFLLRPAPMMELELFPPNDDEKEDDDAVLVKKEDKKIELKDKKRPGMIQCFDPSTREWLGEVPAMTPQQVHEACQKAANAQKSWRLTSFAQRRQVLRTLQSYICRHVVDLCRICARDSGKPCVDALLGEILTTCEKIRCINANGELWLRPSPRPTGPVMMHKTPYVEYVPLGVIGAIAPWNYPFHNYMNHIISGIFAGNAVIGKVSEHTSWSAHFFFHEIVAKALEVNGHDPNLCQTITGFGDAGAALVSDPLVDKIIFTGSPGIGKKVMETASKVLKPVILELGGKDALVITDDCAVKDVVPWVMRGCFQNCGQNCVGIERCVVYEALYDEFLDAVTNQVKGLRQGAPLIACSGTNACGGPADVDCGSMVTEEQLGIIQALVDDAVKKGAKLVCGGSRSTQGNGQFYRPTILADVTPEMRIFQEEVFGPVMTVVKVPNNDDAKCIELVNSSQFGLGSSVYCGNNQARGLELGRQIRSGMMCVNDFGSNYLVQALPFGGVRDSGFGRFAGPEGLRALTLERSIVIDTVPWLAKTSIPPPLSYPIDKERGLGFAESLIQLFYNESWVAKIKGIVGLIKFG